MIRSQSCNNNNYDLLVISAGLKYDLVALNVRCSKIDGLKHSIKIKKTLALL